MTTLNLNQPVFKFQDTEVPKERWCWEAYYSDGTKLFQFDEENGTFHQFQEIDQKKLQLFRMNRNDGSMHYDLLFSPDMKLIHYYTNTSLRDGKYKFKSYCFGFEKNIDGSTFRSLGIITPSDYLTISDEGLNLVVDIN